MYSKNEVFGFYIVLIIVLALIGFSQKDITGGLIGASAGVVASALMYNTFKSQIY